MKHWRKINRGIMFLIHGCYHGNCGLVLARICDVSWDLQISIVTCNALQSLWQSDLSNHLMSTCGCSALVMVFVFIQWLYHLHYDYLKPGLNFILESLAAQ